MPLLGALLSKYLLARYLAQHSSVLSFLVFAALAGKTFFDFFTVGNQETTARCECNSKRCLLALAVATSIDAFLIGSVLGLRTVSLAMSVACIGVITFINSLIGCFIGNKAASFLAHYSRLLAGVILAALAIKALF
jgi:putative Mn2+ efflux pump MntP